MKRILASIIILISILFMPFWLSIIFAVLGLIFFSFFIEGILLMFLSDLLYGSASVRFDNSVFIYLIGFSILLVLIEFLKIKMKVTSSKLGGVYNKL